VIHTQVLAPNLEVKRPFERYRRRHKDNIKMVHKQTEWGGVNWIHMAKEWENFRLF